MKTALPTLFKKAATFRTGTPLWTEDELRNLLDSRPAPPPDHPKTSKKITMITISSLILAAGAAAYFVSADVAPEKAPIPVEQTEIRHIEPAPQQSAPEVVSIKEEQPALALPKVKAPAQVAGINVITLTDEQLNRIGIRRTKTGYELFTRIGVDFNNPAPLSAFLANSDNNRTGVVFDQSKMRSLVKQFGGEITSNTGIITMRVMMDTFGVRSRVVGSREAQATLYPLVITHESTDNSGAEKSQAMFFGSPDDSVSNQEQYRAELVELFDLYNPKPDRSRRNVGTHPLVAKLIPVRISLGSENGTGRADVILWYYPSPAFIEELPEEYRQTIKNELNNIENPGNGGTLQPNEAGEYRYTDVERARNGAIAISAVGPNPARNRTTIYYTLTAERSVQAAIYDMSGRLVASLGRAERMTPGTTLQLPVTLGELSSGGYLISLVTDRGEQAIQRLIIQQ